MNLCYRYTKLGNTFEGCIEVKFEVTDHYSSVRAVLQRIANVENEVIAIDMIRAANPSLEMGTDVFYPDSGDEETPRTIQTVEISEDGKSWNSVSIVR